MTDPTSDAAAETFDVFISYADGDSEWVEGYLVDALEGAGISVQIEATFRLGVPQVHSFDDAVKHCRFVVLILSTSFFADPITRFVEVLATAYGEDQGTWPVIPLILHDVALPPHLAMLNKLPATTPDQWPTAVERLCRELNREGPPRPPPLPCPYPGMMPFGEEQSECFFGRDREVDDILQRLRHHRFLAVIGPSGSGKSSLVSAGLVPELRERGLFGARGWVIVRLRPSQDPPAALERVLGGDLDDPARAAGDLLERSEAQRLLLFVDQLEELFTVARHGVDRFQHALLAIQEAPGCHVVVTVRADFYPQLMTSPLWTQVSKHRIEVVPLEGDALRQAIVGPAEQAGVFIESALTERLVADAAGEPGLLPLVQETMVNLWEHRKRRLLPLRAYEELNASGDVVVLQRQAYGAPPRTGLQVAMVRWADATMADLSDHQQVVARGILLRLVQFGEGRSDVRRQQSISELRSVTADPDQFAITLEHLVDRRLVTSTSSDDTGMQRRFDLAHEALISGWPTFQKWLAERQGGERIRRRLYERSRLWVERGRRTGGLLDEVELLEADRWLSGSEASELGVVEDDVADLVEASRGALEREREEAEAARQRELDQANALAAEQERAAALERQRADEQASSASKLRRFVRALGAASLVLVGLAVFAVLQRNQARAQTETAQSQGLASQAVERVERAPMDSLFLAVKASRARPTPEAYSAILTALQHSPQIVRSLHGYSGIGNSMVFSPDGTTVAAGGDGKVIHVWDVRTGERRFPPLRGHDQRIRGLAFSPDGKVLASAGDDHTIVVWDATTGRLDRRIEGHTGVVRTLAFSPQGVLASASQDHRVMFWDVRTGQRVADPVDLGDDVRTVAFSPDGALLAAGTGDGRVLLLDGHTGASVRPPLLGHTAEVRSVAFSPDGRALASGSNDESVLLWDVQTGQRRGEPLRQHTERVYSVAFSPDGRTLASSSADRTAIAWDVETGTMRYPPLHAHQEGIGTIAFSRDGILATASDDQDVILWDLTKTGRLDTTLGAGPGPIPVAASPNGRVLASGAADGTVVLWDARSGARRGEPLDSHLGPLNSVSLSKSGTTLAASGQDGAVVWNLSSPDKPPRRLTASGPPVSQLVLSPDGKTAFAVGADSTVRRWDTGTGEPLPPLRAGNEELLTVAVSGDGDMAGAGSIDGRIWTWDLGESRPAGKPLNYPGEPIYSLAFSPNGSSIAAGQTGIVRLWKTGEDKPTRRSRELSSGTVSPVGSLAFAPNGRLLAQGNDDGTIILWDPRSPQRIGEPLSVGKNENRIGLAITDDSRSVVAGYEDGNLLAWDVHGPSWRSRACSIVNATLTRDEWRAVSEPGQLYPGTCK